MTRRGRLLCYLCLPHCLSRRASCCCSLHCSWLRTAAGSSAGMRDDATETPEGAAGRGKDDASIEQFLISQRCVARPATRKCMHASFSGCSDVFIACLPGSVLSQSPLHPRQPRQRRRRRRGRPQSRPTQASSPRRRGLWVPQRAWHERRVLPWCKATAQVVQSRPLLWSRWKGVGGAGPHARYQGRGQGLRSGRGCGALLRAL